MLNDSELAVVRGGGGYWDPEFGWVLDTVNVYGGNTLSYANLQYSGTDSELAYAVETVGNTVGLIWNGFVWVWNRTGAQW